MNAISMSKKSGEAYGHLKKPIKIICFLNKTYQYVIVAFFNARDNFAIKIIVIIKRKTYTLIDKMPILRMYLKIFSDCED